MTPETEEKEAICHSGGGVEPAAPARYPPALAFVVQFTAPTAEIVGRAEHIVSGASRRFSSIADLEDFLRSMLVAQGMRKSA